MATLLNGPILSEAGSFFLPWGVAIVGQGACGNGVLDISCIEHRLRELSDIVATRVQSAPFAESLQNALGRTLPARQRQDPGGDKTVGEGATGTP